MSHAPIAAGGALHRRGMMRRCDDSGYRTPGWWWLLFGVSEGFDLFGLRG